MKPSTAGYLLGAFIIACIWAVGAVLIFAAYVAGAQDEGRYEECLSVPLCISSEVYPIERLTIEEWHAGLRLRVDPILIEPTCEPCPPLVIPPDYCWDSPIVDTLTRAVEHAEARIKKLEENLNAAKQRVNELTGQLAVCEGTL